MKRENFNERARWQEKIKQLHDIEQDIGQSASFDQRAASEHRS
jgi:hypothetical protein